MERLRGSSNPQLIRSLHIFCTSEACQQHVFSWILQHVRPRKSLQVILNALGNIEVNGKHAPWLDEMHARWSILNASFPDIIRLTTPAAAGEGDPFQAGQLSAHEMGLRTLKHVLLVSWRVASLPWSRNAFEAAFIGLGTQDRAGQFSEGYDDERTTCRRYIWNIWNVDDLNMLRATADVVTFFELQGWVGAQ